MQNPIRIINLTNAFYESQTLFAALELGIFAFLAEQGPCPAKQIAISCGLDERGTRLLLDGCAALNLVEKTGEDYRNSEESARFLVPGQPGYLGKAIQYNADVYMAWGRLKELVRSGRPVEKPAIHLGADESRTRNFVMSMHGRAMGIGQAVVPRLPLAGCNKILDVGGGPATYATLIAQAYPQAHCTVIDLPGIVRVARELVNQQGEVARRITFIPGDYRLTTFPEGFDCVLFFGVLHQESPESIQDLFKRAYRALQPGGKVFIMDMMTDASHTQPVFSALFALNMALTTEHGWVFSDQEVKEWLGAAGFTGQKVEPLPPPMPHWLASAGKPV
jgi:ubiquinone/menaquinone biosynthesis C-methylase UbiE